MSTQTNNAAAYAATAGRVLLGTIFLLSGISKLSAPAGTIGYIASAGLPFPEVAYAGAVFVELNSSPDIVEILKRVAGEIDAPCLVNVGESGQLGELTTAELEKTGMRIAIYPGLARCAAGYGIREALGVLKRDGSTARARERMLSFQEYNDALGLKEVEEWESRYLR